MPEPTTNAYPARSIEELKKAALSNLPQTTKLSYLVHAIETLVEASENALREKDDEKAYILLTRCFNAFNIVKKTDDYKLHKQYYMDMLGQKLARAMNTLEDLDTRLRKQWELQNKKIEQSTTDSVNDVESKNHQNNNAKMYPQTISDVAPSSEVISFNGFKEIQSNDRVSISSEELFSMLKKRMPGENTTLVIDVRPREDFRTSSMNIKDVINVHRVAAGLTPNRLLKEYLEDEYIPYFQKRKDYDWVILLDWFSVEITDNQSAPINVMMQVLTTWDVNVKYKRKPVILIGGYDEWLSKYPTWCTNPSISPPKSTGYNQHFVLENINYNSPLDFSGDITGSEKKTTANQENFVKPTVDRSTKPGFQDKKTDIFGSIIDDDSSSDDEGRPAPIENGYSSNSKSNSQNGNVERKENDSPAGIPSESSDTEDERLKEACSKKDRRSALTNTVNANNSSIHRNTKNEEGRIDDKEEDEEKEEEDGSNAVLNFNNSEGLYGMKRYSSTPNILKLNISESRPPVDRSTKPSNDDQLNFYTMGYSNEVGRGLTGLKNLGNTCYMNSIIQCLSNTELLRKRLCSLDAHHVNNHSKTRGAVARAMRSILTQLWSGDGGSISCKELKNIVGEHRDTFRGYEQQDSHEFLTILIDWLHEDLKEPPRTQILDGADESSGEKAWGEFTSKNNSIIRHLFYGQLKSTVRCSRCEKESITFEPFSNLSLPLPTEEKCTLGECLNLYVDNESIPGWQCPDCKTPRDATKRLDITRLPPLLVIHFKRFTSGGWCRKRMTNVEFPTILDMNPFIAGQEHRNRKYRLYAISNHFGTMESGHYTAYCLNASNQSWYKFDDQDVTQLSSLPKSSSAYIVFYQSIKN